MSTTTPIHTSPFVFPALRSAIGRMDAAWRWCLGGWLTARVLLSAWALGLWACGWMLPGAGREYWSGVTPLLDGWRGALLGVWLRWDGIYYLRIAAEGYDTARVSAFFPLYPVLSLVAFGGMRLELIFGLLLVSNLALLLALVQLYRLAESLYSPAVARRATAAMLVYPFAFFFFAPYPHSLALLLAMLAYSAARQRQWLLSSLAGLVAGLSHASVLPLCAALAWEAWEQRRLAPEPPPRRAGRFARALPHLGRGLAVITPAGGLAIFLSWRSYAGLPGFTDVQTEYWGRVALWPWQAFSHLARSLAAGGLSGVTWIDLSAALFCLAPTAWAFRRLPVGLRIYQLVMIVSMLSTTTLRSPLASWGRMSLMMFPLFLALGLWTDTRRQRATIAFAAGVCLQLTLVSIYLLWGFVG